jgi:hypothetical protein
LVVTGTYAFFDTKPSRLAGGNPYKFIITKYAKKPPHVAIYPMHP